MLEAIQKKDAEQHALTSQSLSRFLLFSMVVLAFFAVLNFSLGLQLLALVDALVLLTLPLIYSWLKKGAPHGIIKHLIGFDALVIFLPLIFIPTAGNTGIYWMFGYPMLVFFFLGTRTGFVWIYVYFIMLLAGIALSFLDILDLYYTPLQTALALVETVVFTAIGYFFTSDREKAEENLHQAIVQAEAANRAKSEFLSVMSHELRTPLHGIIGLQKLISDDAEKLSHEQRENLKLAQQSAKSLRALVNDVLDLAKIESGNIEIAKARFNLQNCIRDALVPFRTLALEKGITLSLHMEHVPKTIISDESRLRQILLNLIGNAAKFTDRGEISVRVTEEDGRLHFTIKDTGIGIAKEDLKHIFEPFVQASDPSRSQQKGTGLGTSIVKHFVELMKGSIQIESKPGAGTCLSFNIPCYPDGTETVSCDMDATTELFNMTPATDKKPASGKLSSTLRVLLAEDDPIGQRIATKQLSSVGMDVHIVENGEHAWREIQKHAYDLLLTDIRMPGINGIELTRKIRAMEKESETPRLAIIGLSAHALEEVAKECMDAGMDHFMTKPVDPEVILSTILMSTPHNKSKK